MLRNKNFSWKFLESILHIAIIAKCDKTMTEWWQRSNTKVANDFQNISLFCLFNPPCTENPKYWTAQQITQLFYSTAFKFYIYRKCVCVWMRERDKWSRVLGFYPKPYPFSKFSCLKTGRASSASLHILEKKNQDNI